GCGSTFGDLLLPRALGARTGQGGTRPPARLAAAVPARGGRSAGLNTLSRKRLAGALRCAGWPNRRRAEPSGTPVGRALAAREHAGCAGEPPAPASTSAPGTAAPTAAATASRHLELVTALRGVRPDQHHVLACPRHLDDVVLHLVVVRRARLEHTFPRPQARDRVRAHDVDGGAVEHQHRTADRARVVLGKRVAGDHHV